MKGGEAMTMLDQETVVGHVYEAVARSLGEARHFQLGKKLSAKSYSQRVRRRIARLFP